MPVLVFSSKVTASNSIAQQLIPMGFEQVTHHEWKKGDVRLIDCQSESILDIPTDFDTDYILVLSSHKMKQPTPMFTVHFPGNWNEAQFGGTPKTLNVAYASKLKQLLLEIEKASSSSIGWPVNIEVDHHGPTIHVPILYVELGSSENEWGNPEAGKVIAKGISEAIKRNERYKTFFGMGGGHYAQQFFQYVKESEWAAGHILPKYHLSSLDEPLFRQAIEKNVEPVEKVLVLKEETSAKDREKVKQLCEKFKLAYEELR
ncbi:MAG TPA: D-aminoacyl-tRNA deacylase [Candidatus Bilamarchaeaceae archaeon]|nr:D-aminoacyl-tRNA deacylase [Candidatus Bilamarchaeaceae archaeon]